MIELPAPGVTGATAGFAAHPGSGLSVDVEHLAGAFGLRTAFDAARGVTALFGPSGSGKTTLVNLVGGLARPRRGRITLGDTALVDIAAGIFVPPHRRRIGYVFQEARLFPHLTVGQNLSFGRWFSLRREERPEVGPIAELLGISALLDRRPAGLSGGERQRVAIGRALLARPRLLLMDEPLASLDEARKAEIIPHLERLRDEAGVPILYVSHSLAEVARLADTIVVLDSGSVVASGPAGSILARLDIPALVGSRETGAVLNAQVHSHDDRYGLTIVTTRAGPLHLPRLDLPEGSRLRVRIAARDVMVSVAPVQGISALNVLPGRVAELSGVDGLTVDIRLDCSGDAVVARLTRKSVESLSLRAGSPVFAIVKSVSLASG